MNICTYVSAISMKPKLYAVAIYQETKTLENVTNSEFVILQLLHSSHFNLVKKLGHTSGMNYDKELYLTKKEMLTKWQDHFVLKNLSAAILLKKVSNQLLGDHSLFIFEAIKYKSYNTDYLTISDLRKRKLIRI